jgi:hypothetical protein
VLPRERLFSDACLDVGGLALSLNDIEFGILRAAPGMTFPPRDVARALGLLPGSGGGGSGSGGGGGGGGGGSGSSSRSGSAAGSKASVAGAGRAQRGRGGSADRYSVLHR